ncbi:MAG: hypothetical protein ACI89L_002292 [Phycisphaerales bacterium]|jgi:hypothetical protein
MSGMLILGYAVSTTPLWGYALWLLLESRSIRQRERRAL